ncbi:hypothetical protein BB558_007327, partial [Smittium angustum]
MSLLISFVTVFLFYPFLSSSQFTSNAFSQPTPIPGPISSAFPQPGQVPAQFPVSSTFFQFSTPVGPAPTPGGFSSVNGPFPTTSYFTNNEGRYCYNFSIDNDVMPMCTDLSKGPSTSSSIGSSSSSLFVGGVIVLFVIIILRIMYVLLARRRRIVIRAQPQQPRSNIIRNEAINRNSNKKKKI